MIGNIKKDTPIQALPQASDNPVNLYVNPSFRMDWTKARQVTTAKLNGLYNTANMPVVYRRAGQTTAFQMKQTGAKNKGLSHIMFPKRMPYKVT